MASFPMTRAGAAASPASASGPPLAVQILGLVLFAGFAIVATVMAFVKFWPAGFALAVILGWIGFGRVLGPRAILPASAASPAEAPPDPGIPGTGNAAFDAYKAETLRRLEEERSAFEGFLARLRDAKDKQEFDAFMEDRARGARMPDIPDTLRP